MKNRSLTSWLFTPFKFIAGSKALIIGIVILTLLSILGYFGNVHFGGIIGPSIADSSSESPYILHACYQLSAWISMTLVFYITARVVSKTSVRLIDIAGTMAVSQAPFILVALLGLFPDVHLHIGDPNTANIQEIMEVVKENLVIIVMISIISLLVIVWSVALKYNAYSVSANIKGVIGGVSFTIGIIICEILSRLINYMVITLIS
ncbi:MAG: hypothetical protein ACK5M3_10895 [Dysgonomonas sp.]